MRNRTIPRLTRRDQSAQAEAYRDMPILNSLCEGGCGRIVQRSSIRGRCLCATCAGELSVRKAVEKQDAELKSRDPKALSAKERLERAKAHLEAMAERRSKRKKSGALSCSTVDRGHEIDLRIKRSNPTPKRGSPRTSKRISRLRLTRMRGDATLIDGNNWIIPNVAPIP